MREINEDIPYRTVTQGPVDVGPITMIKKYAFIALWIIDMRTTDAIVDTAFTDHDGIHMFFDITEKSMFAIPDVEHTSTHIVIPAWQEWYLWSRQTAARTYVLCTLVRNTSKSRENIMRDIL